MNGISGDHAPYQAEGDYYFNKIMASIHIIVYKEKKIP